MCGIVGALAFKHCNFKIKKDYIDVMRDTMVHRGPNGGGTWVNRESTVGLGHRRLSIIDLSTNANQPMTNENESIWVVFNGEIYNHSDIKEELVKLGNHSFKTDHSDTEVIIHAYEQWGIDCIKRFRGMFGIALWDDNIKKLWLIRDRIGIKPVYYSIHDERIVFASEIKALLKDPEQKKAVNEEALYHYLSFLTTPAPMTLFEGINKLPPATWMSIDEFGNIAQQKYWDALENAQTIRGYKEEDVAKKILDELRTSVKLRKVSDVPVGVFLSGGIDSSTNAALFSEDEKSKVKAFTIGYEGKYQSYHNETDYAKHVADTVNADYYEKLLSVDELIEFLPKMVYLQDEPIADPVCFPVYYVSKLARDNGIVVCQVGEGADELFWGYSHWKTMLKLQRLSDIPLTRGIKKILLKVLHSKGKANSFYYEWLRRGAENQPVFWGGAEAFTEFQKNEILSDRMKHKFKDVTSWDVLKPIRESFEEKAIEKSDLNWMTYLDLNLRLPELLLMRVDKMSMGVSLEARVPFLDHKFVELAMSIPSKMKTKKNISKYILKKAVRGLIPDQIIDRKKQGFGVPIYEWFFDKLGERTREELEYFCKKTDYFKYEELEKLINQGKGAQVWYILNFALWWREYINE